jgi:hypothetical protein
MTPAQLSTLKAAILAETDPAFVAFRTVRNDDGMAAFYNTSVPAFIVWKSSVTKNEVGKAFVASAMAAITAGNNDKLAAFAAYNETIYPSRADQRQFFDDIFSVAAGATTRAALLVLWKRSANRVEKLFATGTGSDASPGTLTFEGSISAQDVSDALRT